jgi:hypothetical protein
VVAPPIAPVVQSESPPAPSPGWEPSTP